ncbi:NAD-binding protein [Pelagicoccus sp. SDUM812003]|uniref:potassium channel family protein n=1 Tax=Pelagicoccus sp. SDUM812003 TaxID=3041267 RepID=UPI00280F41EC|nr:NAD-binding protein [Pelagicoccus sp. SDUM812003]MDQ8201508.1 NAD-binding protein [Pelagicoccus sp. SDUM812003]
MKFLTSSALSFLRGESESRRRNLRLLLRFIVILVIVVAIFSVLFHVIMAWEGQQHSWLTGVYWSLTVMSTLGFGDITFHSDLGRIFSIIVLLTGVVFLLVLLPFTLIEFFYAPWVESRAKRAIRERVSPDVEGHVILLNYDPVSAALIEKLERHGNDYALLASEQEECIRLTDLGVNAYWGDPRQPDTYERLRLQHAGMVALTGNDFENSRLAFTIRSFREDIPIIASAESKSSRDVIRLSGANKTFQLPSLVGEALARRSHGGKSITHKVAQFEDLFIAEAVANTPELEGKTLAEANLRASAGVNVIGLWERGEFLIARPQSTINRNTVLLLAGSETQLETFDRLYRKSDETQSLIIVIGAGRVGAAVCRTLESENANYRVVDRSPHLLKPFGDKGVRGDASSFEVLQEAGIIDARTVVITSHDDDLEVYLTIFCRKLRPDIQIICRATQPETISELHRAGADIVLSYASMGANILSNYFKHSDVLMVAEGLNIFKVQAPPDLQGKTLLEENLVLNTGCNVIAMIADQGMQAPPNPHTPITEGTELILISDADSEARFFSRYNPKKKSSPTNRAET